MKFDILTLVPEAVTGYLDASIIGRAQAGGQIHCSVTNIRDFAEGKHRQVDDAPYGGGSGMVLQPEPVVKAVEAARGRAEEGHRVTTILLSPAGKPLSHELASELAANNDHLILVCGRYEGVDARVDAYVDMELSLGDFVLTGGELAALAVIDTVARLRPGVLGNAESARDESFQDALLEYPQYTRPREFRGVAVPDVLLSGDHEKIRAWRQDAALRRTREQRPDLLTGPSDHGSAAAELLKGLDSDGSRE